MTIFTIFAKTPKRLLITLSTAAVCSVGALLSVDAHQLYLREIGAVKRQLRAEQLLIAAHIESSLKSINRLLGEVADRVDEGGLDQFVRGQYDLEMLHERLESDKTLHSIAIVDTKGEVQWSIGDSLNGQSLSLRTRSISGDHPVVSIGTPLVGPDATRDLIPFSRPLGSPGSSGAVVVILDSASIENAYQTLPARRGRYVRIERMDGTILWRHPASREDLKPEQADQLLASGRLQNGPLAISVTYDYDDWLASLYPAWIRYSLTMLVSTFVIVLSALSLRRTMEDADHVRRRELESLRKQKHSERLSRAITRHLPNGFVAIVDSEFRHLFADGDGSDVPRSIALASFSGRAITEVYPADASARLVALAKSAFAGAESDTEVLFGDQSYKVIAVPLTDDYEEVDEVLLLFQNITESKAMQRELEVHNRKLRNLSFTDTLLDIPNRRAFDQQVDREWRRGSRTNRPLALLMVDVDYFKEYNDSRGHAAGDQCLQEIAAVIQRTITRAADMAARYGGEELAILLPETDLSSALRVAKRLHSRLSEAALPFPESPCNSIVTVSIGAAAMVPSPGRRPTELIEAADSALYSAKEEGRNRTVSQPRRSEVSKVEV